MAHGREEAGVRCVTRNVEVALWVVPALDWFHDRGVGVVIQPGAAD
jgi:hypothetical protein